MHSQTTGDLLPSHKLKGNCTFVTQAMTIGNDEAEKDPAANPDGEGETVSSAGEEVEASSRAGETDQSIEYIIHFTKAIELYQKQNRNCFGGSSPDHLRCDCPKDLSLSAQKADLNMKEGMAKKGGQTSQKSVAAQQTTPDEMP